jgi:hypothetical protein
MKATTWKAVFASMSPSPVFEAVAEFAELMADQRQRAHLKQTKLNAVPWSLGTGEPHERHLHPHSDLSLAVK